MALQTFWLTAIAGSVTYLVYSYILLPAFFSPLARIPAAHWSCAISDLWLKWVRIKDTELDTLEKAHIHHGDLIRVGPKSLSIRDIDDIRMVYNGVFLKADMYRSSDNYDVSCLMSTVDVDETIVRRRLLAKVFSKTFVQSSKSVQTQLSIIVFDRLLPLLRQEAASSGSQGTEIEPISMSVIIDSMSAHLFGINNSTNFVSDVTARDNWLVLFYKIADRMVWARDFPLVIKVLGKLGIKLNSKISDDAADAMLLWNKQMCQNALESLSRTSLECPENYPAVVAALQSGFASEATKPGSPFNGKSKTEQETLVASETMDEVLAGQDPATTLTYMLWHLSTSPDVQDQLRNEIHSSGLAMKMHDASRDRLPDAKVLDALPILDAVLTETLRLHPPLPYAERRIVPNPSSLINGHVIPGGTQVAASPYIIHRDERAYPDPLQWDHKRWLGQAYSAEVHERMDKQYWAFSSGGRGCIATAFVLNQLKFIIAGIYANFETSIANDGGLKQDYTTMTTMGEGLFLRFKPLSD